MNDDVKPKESTVKMRPDWARIVAVIAALFGLLTIREGGAVIFGNDAARLAAGNFVPFVVWFNFLAGFIYFVAGLGLWLQRRWAIRVAFSIAVATLVVFAAFGVHVATGGAFEMRTVLAMTLRVVVWFAIAAIGRRALIGKVA
jgi:hypothetical protein